MQEKEYVVLRKGNTEIVIDIHGGQVVSWKVNGVELLFQGATDPTQQWNGSAKVLFPQPGPIGPEGAKEEIIDQNGRKVKATVYTFDGGIYKVGRHGHILDMDFEVQGKGKDWCIMSTASNERTAEFFPFYYIFYLQYGLADDGSIQYKSVAQNQDTIPMPGGMGWHPAFQLHDHPSKYKVVLRNLVKTKDCELKEGVKYDAYQKCVDDEKATTYDGIISADVTIVYESENGDVDYVTLHTESPQLLLWTEPKKRPDQQDFLCMEPWNTPTRQLAKLTTRDKIRGLAEEGMVLIEPGKAEKLKATVSVNPEYIKLFANEADKTND